MGRRLQRSSSAQVSDLPQVAPHRQTCRKAFRGGTPPRLHYEGNCVDICTGRKRDRNFEVHMMQILKSNRIELSTFRSTERPRTKKSTGVDGSLLEVTANSFLNSSVGVHAPLMKAYLGIKLVLKELHLTWRC